MAIVTFFLGLIAGSVIGATCDWRKVLAKLGAFATAAATKTPPPAAKTIAPAAKVIQGQDQS
jgi:hypothetical protein